jgi:hypothetical protein
VRLQRIAYLVIAVFGGACASYGQIHNLSLAWRGVDTWPRPSAPIAQAFAAAPFAFALRDSRLDPSSVGTYEDDGFVVRTGDNVAQYCSTRFGEILGHAGARLREPPTAVLEAELLEYNVVESGMFNGVVRVRAVVHGGADRSWSRTFVGKSARWGRTHNPENFNEALSNALADAASQLMQDDDFARALVGEPPPPPPRPPGA